MYNIVLKLTPARLTNPDLDIRYVLPELIVEQSDGLIIEDGYDYEAETSALLIYLLTEDLEKALLYVNALIINSQVLGNDLRDAIEIIVEP